MQLLYKNLQILVKCNLLKLFLLNWFLMGCEFIESHIFRTIITFTSLLTDTYEKMDYLDEVLSHKNNLTKFIRFYAFSWISYRQRYLYWTSEIGLGAFFYETQTFFDATDDAGWMDQPPPAGHAGIP